MTPPDTVAEDLGQLPWFQVVGTEQYVAQVLDQIDLDNAPHIVEAESFEFACAMVSQGLGVSLIPESAVTGSTHSESTTPTVRVPISVIANTLDSTSSELVTNLLRQFGRHTRDVASSHTEPARQAAEFLWSLAVFEPALPGVSPDVSLTLRAGALYTAAHGAFPGDLPRRSGPAGEGAAVRGAAG